MYEWARELRKKTDNGAMLFFDGELWLSPRWIIQENRIGFSCGNTTQMLLEPGDDPDEALNEVRGRVKLLIEA